MPQKKITDLQLIGSLAGTENFPVDDTIQTYRATLAQAKDYVLGAGNIRAFRSIVSASLTAAVGIDVYLCDASSGGFTVTMPDPATMPGKVFTIEKLYSDTSNNAIVVSGTGMTEKRIMRTGGFIQLMAEGSTWYVIKKKLGTNLIELTDDMGSWTVNTSWITRYQVHENEEFVDIVYDVSCGGSPNSTTLQADLPPDLTLDSSKLINTADNFETLLGICNMRDDSASYQYGITGVYYNPNLTGNSNMFWPLYQSTAGRELSISSNSVPHTWGSGDKVNMVIKDLPITAYWT